MNTDTKQNINANTYIRTNADTSANNHTYLYFHAGIKNTSILTVCNILAVVFIFILMHLLAAIHIYLLPYVSKIEISYYCEHVAL